MTDIEKYELINSCETADTLARAIETISDSGFVTGRRKVFSTKKMALNVFVYFADECPANVLTRSFGIRQQAMYIKSWKKYAKGINDNFAIVHPYYKDKNSKG